MIEQLLDPPQAQQWAREAARTGRLGLVPTMGALHEGHLALVRTARALCDQVVVSIFVNPAQFGPNEDYERYPRSMEADLASLEREGATAAFLPKADVMYPGGFRTTVEVEGLSNILEGSIRPGHFRGVTTVVSKLFNILPAHTAVFGQKDYQQLLVIRRMATDLNFPMEIVAQPTVREPDGLAMSSRNRYLTSDERCSALALSRALSAVREAAAAGQADQGELESVAWSVLDDEDRVVPDYAVVLDPDTLAPLEDGWERAVCLVAGRLGKTRLIDNVLFARDGSEVTA